MLHWLLYEVLQPRYPVMRLFRYITMRTALATFIA